MYWVFHKTRCIRQFSLFIHTMKHWCRSSVSLVATFALVLNALVLPISAVAQGITSDQIVTDVEITAEPVTETEVSPTETDPTPTPEAEESTLSEEEDSSESEASESSGGGISSDAVETEETSDIRPPAAPGGVSADAVANPYFNGFETDTTDWNDYLGSTITRVASGYNGVTSADGDYHAVLGLGDLIDSGTYAGQRIGPFTRWGGYEDTWPTGGYITELDIYLDMSESDGATAKNIDYSSAISTPAGNHRRDFIFHIGTSTSQANEWAVNASNNAPNDPNYTGSAVIDATGWYTFRHSFLDNGSGILEVVMEVLDTSGNVLGTWTRTDPSDTIGTNVGGNRYGWIVTNDFDELAIDNSEKMSNPTENISPILECVAQVGDGKAVAFWGYENKNEFGVNIPVGPNNKMTGGGLTGQGQGQPSFFEYPAPNFPSQTRMGRTGFYPNNAFSVEFDNSSNLVWTLEAPNGTRKTATAGKDVDNCDWDYGDAPDEPVMAIREAAIITNYQTLKVNDGARHLPIDLKLGRNRDVESDGQPTVDADGDDVNPVEKDDEDGLISIDPLQQGDIAKLVVGVNGDGGFLNVWIDYNKDGDFDDNLEHVVVGEAVATGPETFYLQVPADAVLGDTYMRIRLSTTETLDSFGPAADGEVEDYKVEVTQPIIFGYKWFDADQDGFWDKDNTGNWDYDYDNYYDNDEEWPIDNWLIVAKNEADAPIWEAEVEANDGGLDDGEDSPILEDGKIYLIEAEGTFYSGYTGPTTLSAQDYYGPYLDVVADAEYLSNDDWNTYDNPTDLELQIDDQDVNWGSYNDAHLYKYVYEGEGKSINLSIYEEQYEWYQDNFGSLDVRIYDVTETSTRTDANGYYEIPVEAGEYQVVEELYGRWETTTPVNPSYCHLTTGDQDVRIQADAVMTLEDQYNLYNTECSFGNYQEPRDYGDAPEFDWGGYPTTEHNYGAYHVIDWGFHLGSTIDMENDGQPTVLADGDDNEYSDDEDGVIFTSPIIPNEFATVEVTASGSGLLDAWIDFNDDGDWEDAGEQIFVYEYIEYGINELTFFVPEDVAAGEAPYARFRFSTEGSDSPYGRAEDGEVEDYLVQIDEGTPYSYAPYCGDGLVNQEWEDCDPAANIIAADYNEPVCNNQCQFVDTLQCKDLALAKITIDEVKNWRGGNMDNDIYLGDATAKIPHNVWFPIYWNGYYFSDPDVETADYEDVPGLAVQRGVGDVRVVMHASHDPALQYNSAVDDESAKDIDDVDDSITAEVRKQGLPKEHANGVISFWNSYPTYLESDTYDNQIENYYDGTGFDEYRANNDEVFIDDILDEVIFHITANKYDDGFYVDFEETISCEDFGDAPASYPTLLNADPIKDGARHPIGSLTLGDFRDGEYDGQPVPAGAGDDLNGLLEFEGNPVQDEDGVEFVGGNTISANTSKEIKVNIEGYHGRLDAWVDFNGDGDWSNPDGTDDVGEKIFHSYLLEPGTTELSFHVPWYVQPGETYARFRISTEGGLFPYGPAYDGEVEDYQLIADRPFGYCGDGEVNQIWEECEPGNQVDMSALGYQPYCNEKCQYEDDNQCKDLVLARVNIENGRNWGGGDMSQNIFLGSDQNVMPRGKWFAISYLGHLITDPDMTSAGYEDVPGLAVERDQGRVRVLLAGKGYGDHTSAAAAEDAGWYSDYKEHAHGHLEFWGTVPTATYSDDYSYNNELEGDYNDGSGFGQYDPYDDELTIGGTESEFYLTVKYDDDGVWTEYDESIFPICKDFGDAPEEKYGHHVNAVSSEGTPYVFQGTGPSGYPTTIANGGASHIVSPLTMGYNIDGEFDGQPNKFAAGDDDNGHPDDEDGVYFKDDNLTLVAYNGWNEDVATKKIDITSTDFAYVDGWVDFNRDGDWDDYGEQILGSEPVVPGSNWFEFDTPWYAEPGESFARFRISYTGGLSPYDHAYEGEVEDYIVYIERQAGYCGDGELNQAWEQCEPGGESIFGSQDYYGACNEYCQYTDDYACNDLVLATVRSNTDDFSDTSAYVGEAGQAIPFGSWFALYWQGNYVTDPDAILAGYDDVPGIAVERNEGAVRTVLSSDNGTRNFDGALEFWNNSYTTGVTTLPTSNYSDYYYLLEPNDILSLSFNKSEMDLTVTGGKDAVWHEYAPLPVCESDDGGDNNGGGGNGGGDGGDGGSCDASTTIDTLLAEGNGDTVVFTTVQDPAVEVEIPTEVDVLSGPLPSDGSALIKYSKNGETPVVCEYVALTGDETFAFEACYDDPFNEGIVTFAIGTTPNDFGPGLANPTIETQSVTLDISGSYTGADVQVQTTVTTPGDCPEPTPTDSPTPTPTTSESPTPTPTTSESPTPTPTESEPPTPTPTDAAATASSGGGGGGGGGSRAFCENPPVLSAITPIKNGTYNTLPNISFNVTDDADMEGISVKVDGQAVEATVTEGDGIYEVTADTSTVDVENGTITVSIKADADRPLCWKHASYSITIDADASNTDDGSSYEESDFESGPEGSLFSDEEDYLGALADRGILNSDGDSETELNRATAAQIIVGVLGLVAEEVTGNPFPDVQVSAWHAPFIAVLKEAGILSGYGDGLFRPMNTITRAEAYKILYLASDKPLSSGSASCVDLETGAWYLPYMQAAFQDDVIIGGTEIICGPHKVITQGEFAELIIRFFGLE